MPMSSPSGAGTAGLSSWPRRKVTSWPDLAPRLVISGWLQEAVGACKGVSGTPNVPCGFYRLCVSGDVNVAAHPFL